MSLQGLIDAAARLGVERCGALQLLEPPAQPEERAAQIVRGAVEGGAHGHGLLIEPRQHVIDGDRQGIEFVARSADRQAAREIPADDLLAGARDGAHARHQPARSATAP